MAYKFNKCVNNIYLIDTKMFGFEHYQSCYVVKGKEIVLVDAGIPSQFDAFRIGLKEHGFSIHDISKIFLTHCEHPYYKLKHRFHSHLRRSVRAV